jgi:hypothetical protein
VVHFVMAGAVEEDSPAARDDIDLVSLVLFLRVDPSGWYISTAGDL